MRLFAIDPGSSVSGWVLLRPETRILLDAGVDDNREVLAWLHGKEVRGKTFQQAVYERVVPMGFSVGATIFDTVWWTGAFCEAFNGTDCESVPWVSRNQVKVAMCGQCTKVNDAAIRKRLLWLYSEDGRLSEREVVGTRKHPGPLHGVKSHAWSALAVAHTYLNKEESA